ncbi:MAG: hypothetical protein HY301_09695, partial [Verrucomicrobia bacterium]|nr:hypothetical protein [Verrucomicrobiota bacterium]
MKQLRLLFAWLWLSTNWAGAHGDVHERLAAATAELEKNPADAVLLVRRGELHREHRDWGAALADFGRAAKLDAKVATDFFKGRVLAD